MSNTWMSKSVRTGLSVLLILIFGLTAFASVMHLKVLPTFSALNADTTHVQKAALTQDDQVRLVEATSPSPQALSTGNDKEVAAKPKPFVSGHKQAYVNKAEHHLSALSADEIHIQKVALIRDDHLNPSDVTPPLPELSARHKDRAVLKPKPLVPTLKARINLTAQRMTVSSKGRILHRWRISSGRRGYETPTGRFKPTWMARRWYSRQYRRSPMPYSVFFNRGIATHGTSAVRRLGNPASHGCIRLRTANARTFYKLVQKHGKERTQIIVTGRAKQRRYVKRKRRYQYRNSRMSRRNYKKARYNKKKARYSKRVSLHQKEHFRIAFSSD